jgi:hypothetical protein
MPLDSNGNYYININPFPPQNIGASGVVYGPGAPGSAPTFGQRVFVNTATGACYVSQNGVWVQVATAVPTVQLA